MPEATVVVEHLTRRFRRRAETVTALDDVSMQLYPGELTVVAGPSGSGKTTLLAILAGFDHADGGAIDVKRWRDVAFVPQSITLLDELTTRENIELPALLDPGADGENTEELMDRLHIAQVADRYPSLTSGGEQQRTALGRALRLRPALLLADEPTGHQDRERVDLILGVLRAHAYAGNTVLISSHDQAVIAGADRVLTLTDGRLAS